MRLQTRIILWVTGIILLSATVTLALCVSLLLRNANRAFEKTLLEVAESVTKMPEILEGLKHPPSQDGIIQHRTGQMIESFAYIDMIVVCNMKGERYSHPNASLIGIVYRDMETAGKVRRGEQFISETLRPYGLLIRYFTPIFDGDTQLGFVVVSAVSSKIEFERYQIYSASIVFLIVGLAIGTFCSILLSKKIKSMLLGLEPDDLARLYKEHTGMVEAMHEGVIAVNTSGQIRMSNESARKLLCMEEEDLRKQEIADVMPDTRLTEVLSSGIPAFDQEERVQGKILVTNTVPIVVKDKIVGAVETLQDKTQIIRMAEELTGFKQLVDSFRASSHEFSNKLQALSGMLQMGDYANAKKFIVDTSARQDELQNNMLATFKEPMLAGLVLGKFSFAAEQRVALSIAFGSYLGPISNPAVAHEMVTIIGNLVDNAVEACRNNPDGNGSVTVHIADDDNAVTLRVADNGPGIRPDVGATIFQRGFSTKGTGRGTGLYLVRQSVRVLDGDISVESQNGKTEFTVIIPRSAGEGND